MATLELSFRNSSTLDAGLNTADSMSVSFSDTLNQIDSNFQEFDYGTPYVWNASNTRIDGSISSGGNFIITGSNLLGSVATINYLSYTDNYPAATLQLFGSVTSTDSWTNGTLTKITYSTSNLSFELIGSIPINSYGTANSFVSLPARSVIPTQAAGIRSQRPSKAVSPSTTIPFRAPSNRPFSPLTVNTSSFPA